MSGLHVVALPWLLVTLALPPLLPPWPANGAADLRAAPFRQGGLVRKRGTFADDGPARGRLGPVSTVAAHELMERTWLRHREQRADSPPTAPAP